MYSRARLDAISRLRENLQMKQKVPSPHRLHDGLDITALADALQYGLSLAGLPGPQRLEQRAQRGV